MTPASDEDGLFQALALQWPAKLGTDSHANCECSLLTRAEGKVADAAWAKYAFFKLRWRSNPYPESWEIVVEILPPSNTQAELGEKKEPHFAHGTQEFRTCGQGGSLRVFDNHRRSHRCGPMPDRPNPI